VPGDQEAAEARNNFFVNTATDSSVNGMTSTEIVQGADLIVDLNMETYVQTDGDYVQNDDTGDYVPPIKIPRLKTAKITTTAPLLPGWTQGAVLDRSTNPTSLTPEVKCANLPILKLDSYDFDFEPMQEAPGISRSFEHSLRRPKIQSYPYPNPDEVINPDGDSGVDPNQAWIPATTDETWGLDSWGFRESLRLMNYWEVQGQTHGVLESKPKVKFESYKYRTEAGNFWIESEGRYYCTICHGEYGEEKPLTKMAWVGHMWRTHCVNLSERYQCKFCKTSYSLFPKLPILIPNFLFPTGQTQEI